MFEVPDYIPFQMLKEEIINTQLSLKAAASETNDNNADIEKLTKLYKDVEQKEQEWTDINNTPDEVQQTEEGVPMAENVLTQEAQMQQVPPAAPMGDMTGGADMAVDTPDGGAALGQWNTAPLQ